MVRTFTGPPSRRICYALKELTLPVNRTVVLSEVAYRRLEAYARISDVSIECAASDAIAEWMNSTGDLVIEAIQKKRNAGESKPKLTLVWSASPA